MGSSEGLRQHARFMVRWPMLYGNDGLIAEGTLLDVSHAGCRVAGTMPVAVGMLLRLWVSPVQREETVYVKEARVLWTREHEFGLELRHVDPQDHQWLIGFLEHAERRHSFRRKLQPSSKTDLAALALPLKK